MLTVTADAQTAATTDALIVKTAYGPVRGGARDGVREFKGIPYAAAPVGDLRWRMPRPPKPWTGVLGATRYGGY